jgi:transcriptional regulator with XRE-family HTH domain
MGYGGKVPEQRRARELRAQAWTLQDIATELGVSKSSVSLWVRDVDFVPNPPRRSRARRPSSLHTRKLAEIERCKHEGVARLGQLSEREFLVLGAALYAGEGFKGGHAVGIANTDPRILVSFVTWLRRFFDVDETRLRVRLYLHDGLDLEAAEVYWSELLVIPREQFQRPYRAHADATRRRAKHVFGCPAITYSCTFTQRRVMGLVGAILSTAALPG